MLMVNEKIDVDSNAVDSLNVDLFKMVKETSLIDMLLEWMK